MWLGVTAWWNAAGSAIVLDPYSRQGKARTAVVVESESRLIEHLVVPPALNSPGVETFPSLVEENGKIVIADVRSADYSGRTIEHPDGSIFALKAELFRPDDYDEIVPRSDLNSLQLGVTPLGWLPTGELAVRGELIAPRPHAKWDSKRVRTWIAAIDLTTSKVRKLTNDLEGIAHALEPAGYHTREEKTSDSRRSLPSIGSAIFYLTDYSTTWDSWNQSPQALVRLDTSSGQLQELFKGVRLRLVATLKATETSSEALLVSAYGPRKDMVIWQISTDGKTPPHQIADLENARENSHHGPSYPDGESVQFLVPLDQRSVVLLGFATVKVFPLNRRGKIRTVQFRPFAPENRDWFAGPPQSGLAGNRIVTPFMNIDIRNGKQNLPREAKRIARIIPSQCTRT